MERNDARSRILGALRTTSIADSPLPDHEGPWTTPADLVATFCANARAAGASVLPGAGTQGDRSLEAAIRAHIAALCAQRVVSVGLELAIEGIENTTSVARPHDFGNVDLAIVRAEFGVAENGAVWITDHDVSERSLWFLCEHLLVVLDPRAIVPHMHAAYERVTAIDSAFGMFLAGPSKTADIEQALVIGAHGPRSLADLLM